MKAWTVVFNIFLLLSSVLSDDGGLVFDHYKEMFSYDVIDAGLCSSDYLLRPLPDTFDPPKNVAKKQSDLISQTYVFIQELDISVLCKIHKSRNDFLQIQEEMTTTEALENRTVAYQMLRRDLLKLVPSHVSCIKKKPATEQAKLLGSLMKRADCYLKNSNDFAIDKRLMQLYAPLYTMFKRMRICKKKKGVEAMDECHRKLAKDKKDEYVLRKANLDSVLLEMATDLEKYKKDFPNGCGHFLKMYLNNLKPNEPGPIPLCINEVGTPV